MYIRHEPRYNNYQELWQNGYRSPYFTATAKDASPEEDLSLSERLLFTQSNGRTLLGQDTQGQMHFICSPDENDYAIPSGGPRVGGQFSGHIGQYYQSDLAMLLGKLRYQIHLDNGLLQDAAGEGAHTWYLDHFLPVTETVRPHMITRIFSLAPILEMESKKTSSLHPLPGPCGAIFGLSIENNGTTPLNGTLKLRLNQDFVADNEEYGMIFEEASVKPHKVEWDRKLLTLWRPDAYATIQLLGANTSGEASDPQIHHPFYLDVGQSQTFTCIVTITPDKHGAHAALGTLYQHTSLEWINITGDFWHDRLGDFKIGIHEDPNFGPKYRDMHIRFVLDNFNCMMFRQNGEMLANWQGAPSHGLCRLWGIDIEPTVISVMYAVPEIGPSSIRYILERSTPRFSIYPDHSVSIYIAPLAIAGKYLELTGDVDFFLADKKVMNGLHEHVQKLMEFKHKEKSLFSSRYASDLIVFRKYDYGTNVKCFYALKSYAAILRAIGQDPTGIEDLLENMKTDMSESMEGEGPFGRQITGGSNLGENEEERFYIPEEIFYYGGEDSFTCMAPLYGLYEFDYKPWINLHRYSHSLFISNYDLEYQSLRELHYGMNPSATGNTLRLGGSVTRKEMCKSLGILFNRLDVSGSLFWWPRSVNKRRCLTRCSQGQGSWIQQSMEQWLGIRMDAVSRVLTIRPQGMIDQIHLKQIRIGIFRFNIDWNETEAGTSFSIKNLNDVSFKVRIGVRSFGMGAEGKLEYFETEIASKEEFSDIFSLSEKQVIEEEYCIPRRECELLAENGIVFGPYGLSMPKLYGGDCNIFLLRYAVVNGTGKTWEDAQVELELPSGFQAAEKDMFVWNYLPQFKGGKIKASLGKVYPFEHRVAGFYVLLDRTMRGNNNVLLSRHMFQKPSSSKTIPLTMHIGAMQEKLVDMPIKAKLYAGEFTVEHDLQVQVHDNEKFSEIFDRMIHG